MKNIFTTITSIPSTLASKYMPTQTHQWYSPDKHEIKIYNSHIYPTLQSQLTPHKCKKIPLNDPLNNSYNKQVTLGRGDKVDIEVYNPSASRGEQLTFLLKRNNNIYIQTSKTAKNGIWKLYWGLIPIPCNGKEHQLNHGNTYFLSWPILFFSLFDWSIGTSVKIKYYNPIPFPFNVIRNLKILILRSLKLAGTLIVSFLIPFVIWLILNWSDVPGEKLPAFNGAPVVIYASDYRTPLKPLPAPRPNNIEDLSSFGRYLPSAVLASEDRRYRQHFGVDILGIIRSLISGVFFKTPQGGSTIHQQVARTLYPNWVQRNLEYKLANTLLEKPVTLLRKILEIPVAIKLNFSHSKKEILLTYLNSAPLGREQYGFAEASQYYFNKSVDKLNLTESATLVALLTEPNNFVNIGLCSSNGTKYLNKLSDRRRRVIDWMQKEGYINNVGLIRQAKLIPITNLFDSKVCHPTENNPIIPRIYESLIYRELYNLMQEEYQEGNLVIETSIDAHKQRQAQRSLEGFVKSKGQKRGVSQGALVSINSTNGEIVAVVEAVEPQTPYYGYKRQPNDKDRVFTRDEKECLAGDSCIKLQYNFATGEDLFPGSTFKVFAYTAAIEEGVSPGKIYNCEPFNFAGERFDANNWKDSYCQSVRGSIDMLTAMGTSDNLTALKVAKDAGLERVIKTAQRMGINSKLDNNPRLILGNSPVKLLEMTKGYGVLASRGYKTHPHLIRRIIDISSPQCSYKNYRHNPECVVLYAYDGDTAAGLKPAQQKSVEEKQVISSDVADKVTDLMRATVADSGNGRPKGTASNVNIRNAAGKTGTTEQRQDLWFIGFVPGDLVTGVWLGNPTFERKPTNVGSADAAQVWQDYMESSGY
jgi:penicillin-binding protein 1A